MAQTSNSLLSAYQLQSLKLLSTLIPVVATQRPMRQAHNALAPRPQVEQGQQQCTAPAHPATLPPTLKRVFSSTTTIRVPTRTRLQARSVPVPLTAVTRMMAWTTLCTGSRPRRISSLHSISGLSEVGQTPRPWPLSPVVSSCSLRVTLSLVTTLRDLQVRTPLATISVVSTRQGSILISASGQS